MRLTDKQLDLLDLCCGDTQWTLRVRIFYSDSESSKQEMNQMMSEINEVRALLKDKRE